MAKIYRQVNQQHFDIEGGLRREDLIINTL
jgi:hypothetical protein